MDFDIDVSIFIAYIHNFYMSIFKMLTNHNVGEELILNEI